MNNLAGVIPVSTQRLRSRISDDPKAEQILDTIDHQAEFLLRLSDDLLKPFSHVETGVFDVNVLVRETAEVARPMLEKAGIELIHRVGDDLPPIRISNLLSEAFLELIMNAAKAMSTGGNLIIKTSLSESGHAIKVAFSDNGHGIPPNQQTLVFELFARGGERPSTPQALNRGIGFGLWWVKTFLQQWGADVDLAWSEMGKGSAFVVTLPVEV